MIIGFITPEYPHPFYKGNIGGIGTFTKTIAEKLIESNHKVFVFIYSQSYESIIYENGVEIHFVKRKSFKGLTWYINRKYFNVYVNRVVKKNNIDVLEAPDWTGFTAFMNFKIPLIIRLHGSDTFFCHLEQRKVKFKNKFFENRAIKGADRIVAVSYFVANKTKELFNYTNHISIIYNAIDINEFKPNHQKIIPKTLLYFGTIIRKKGVLQIAECFNKVVEINNQVQLCFLGRDSVDFFTKKSTLNLCKEIFSDKAIKNFKYFKEVPYKKVVDFIQKSEVILLPSFAEAFPMTWLEAMALEKKMITSNIGWSNEIMINGQTGYTVSPNDIDDFTNKIVSLLNNDQLSKQMSISARKRIIESFSLDKKIDSNIQLYKSLIK